MAIVTFVTRWIAFGIGCLYSNFVLFGLFIGFIKSPLSFFSWKKREEVPSCLNDPDYGTHGYVHLEEVKLHYVTHGDESKPLMLFVHGFPEFWYSWRHQLKEFKKDYRVVAIDNRGYGDSDKPSGVDNYGITKMVADLKQLIPALGHRSCVLVAHDWGGAIAWAFAALHPELVDKLIIMNCPHLSIFRKYMEKHLSQFKKSWYIFFFQVPFLPEIALSVQDYKAIDRIFGGKAAGLACGKFTKEDAEAYKYAISRPGALTCAINYYRALLRYPTGRLPNVTPPVLTIWGNKDVALEKEMAIDAETCVNDLTIKYIEEASHWVQMDTPDKVNKLMREFLK